VRPFLLALPLALAPSCVTVDWSRESRSSPPPQDATDVLVEGRSTLHDALALLGAPLHVYEYKQLGAALVYGWYEGNLGLRREAWRALSALDNSRFRVNERIAVFRLTTPLSGSREELVEAEARLQRFGEVMRKAIDAS